MHFWGECCKFAGGNNVINTFMERVTGLLLDQLIKHYLIKEYMSGIENMCVKKILPLCAAILYPFSENEIIREPRPEYILSIINATKKFARKKENLGDYTLEGLRNFFEYRWLPTLDFNKQKQLIEGISLIDKVEDNGFFSLKGSDKVFDAYLNRPVMDISGKYGNTPFEIPDEDTLNVEDAEIAVNVENQDDNGDNISLDSLVNFLRSALPNGLGTDRYFWEYKLNSAQYNALKQQLLKLKLENNTGKKLKIKIRSYGTVARVVALYVSEWYKRECPTLDGDRCLETIGLNSGDSSSVWKGSGLPDNYLHQGDVSQQMRQIAMCALGGLPLRVVNSSPRFKNLVNGLFDIYQKGEAADEDIENVINSFDDNNGVFKRSLVSGSCKKYLLQLVKYLESGKTIDLPFNESDINESLFSEFVRKLKEGWDEELSKRFITREIRIWTYDYYEEGDDSSQIECEFYVHIGPQKSKNVITKRELVKLGVSLPDEVTKFKLRLSMTMEDGSEIWSKGFRTYFKIGNNCEDFCGAFGSDIATNIDLFNTNYISIWIEWEGKKQKIEKWSCKVPRYFQLYATDDFYLWTTKTNNAARQVLFYDSEYYTPQNEDDLDIQVKSSKNNTWGWIYLKDSITLRGRGVDDVPVTVGASELIAVDFRTKELRKNIDLNFEGCIKKSIMDGEVGGPVPLLYYSHHRNLMLMCDGEKDDQLRNNYTIEFLNDRTYQEWTDDNCPTQGFVKLKITCKDSGRRKRPWKGTAFFIPESGQIVRRNLDNNIIYINADNICPEDNALNRYSINANENFKYRFQDGSDCGLDSSTLSFRVGDERNHIILDVYRAFNWQQIWNNDTLVKDKIDGDEPPVSIILQKNIKIKVVNGDGYNEHAPDYCKYINYFKDPREIAFCENDNAVIGSVDGDSQTYQPYVYLGRYEDRSQGGVKIREIEKRDNAIILHVSDKHIEEYVFYYWSGVKEDDPILLEREKIESKKYRFKIPTPLGDKAIVFQSLKECAPNFYFRPFYADDTWRWEYYINRYGNVDTDYLTRCYQLAVQHGVYFCIFPGLRVLQDRNQFTGFVKSFVQHQNYALSYKDCDNLTRLAKELAMDWFFVNRRLLFDNLDDGQASNMRKCMERLLSLSPICKKGRGCSRQFIKRFLEDTGNFNVRNGRLPRQFLKSLDDFRNYNGCENTEGRIVFLNELLTTEENLFSRICEILNI